METLRQILQSDVDLAFVELGLSEEEFLRQTPRQWQRRKNLLLEREKRADRRIARICAALAWVNGNSTVTEEDFIPRPAEPEQTEEEMLAELQKAAPPKHKPQ